MGTKIQRSQTETGLKFIYQYFILHFLLLLSLLLLSIALILNQQDLLSLSASKVYFVAAIIFLFIFIFLWFFRGVASILNGRLEFSHPHDSNVIKATLLLVIYTILFFINLSLAQGFTGGTAFVAAISAGFSSSILPQFISVLVLSIISHVLLGLALIHIIKKFISDEQKRKLNNIFVLLVFSTFTINITGLIAYYLFFKMYRDIFQEIRDGKIKPSIIAPCPNCSNDIPIESESCQYCGAKFDKKALEEIDSTLSKL